MKQTKEELWAVAAEYYKLKSEGKNPIVQYLYRNNIWTDYKADTPNFNNGEIWRLKPELEEHRGGEYPKPCTDVDEMLQAGIVYEPSFHVEGNGAVEPTFLRLDIDRTYARSYLEGMAKSGLYYLKRDDAIARAKVMYEID